MSEISAGAITYTMKDHVPFYLLIKDFHGNYGFAKGHLEKGETETQAAIREIKEEVGIDIRLDTSFREELSYIMPNGILKTSVYFLGCFKDQTPVKQPEEVDEICLLSYEEAMNLLSFDNMKGVLVKADQYLKNHYEQKSLTDH